MSNEALVAFGVFFGFMVQVSAGILQTAGVYLCGKISVIEQKPWYHLVWYQVIGLVYVVLASVCVIASLEADSAIGWQLFVFFGAGSVCYDVLVILKKHYISWVILAIYVGLASMLEFVCQFDSESIPVLIVLLGLYVGSSRVFTYYHSRWTNSQHSLGETEFAKRFDKLSAAYREAFIEPL
jgi:hypothetical protein